MGLTDDIHTGFCMGVVLAIKFFYDGGGGPTGLGGGMMERDGSSWAPQFMSFCIIVPLIGYGKPLSHYVTVFLSGWTMYYFILRAKEISDWLCNSFRETAAAFYYGPPSGEDIMLAIPNRLQRYISSKLGPPPSSSASSSFGPMTNQKGTLGGLGFDGGPAFKQQNSSSSPYTNGSLSKKSCFSSGRTGVAGPP